MAAIRALKRSARDRRSLLRWRGTQGLAGLPSEAVDDHTVAAGAAALAARDWCRGEGRWVHPADPPAHPDAFAC